MSETAMNAAEFRAVGNRAGDYAESGISSVPEVPDFKWWAVKDSNLGPAD
jgi:hypothetical protein